MPFMSYQVSIESAVVAAGRVLKETGCEAIKLEGGAAVAPQIAACVAAGIPVMGHLGLTPQSVHAFGGYRVQGRAAEAQEELLKAAQAIEKAGVYSFVLEGIPSDLAERITKSVNVPTIGIFAGPHCDGQVLVCYDMLGLQPAVHFRHVKRYAELGTTIIDATRTYIREVQSHEFPDAAHCAPPESNNR
jgi:3-methyl-2-oxobutanoate hydroxymethyltransferase